MSAWQSVPIRETYLGLYDGPHATPKPADEGPIFLGIGNITEDGHLDLSSVRHIAEEDMPAWTKRVTPQAGDIVFTYEATLNRYAIIPEGFRGCLGRRLALIRPNPAVVNTRWLHHYFFGQDWRATISANTLAGATVERVPLTKFPDFPVELPPLAEQDRIASILSAYDDLIENNTRRIAILEEMARRIYEEWFVRFRFPGHENVRMVESELGLVPEGWKVAPFTELADVLSGGTPKKANPEYWDGPIPFYTPKDFPKAPFVLTTESGVTELGASKCNSNVYPKETVFITARGTVGNVTLASRPMIMNQSCYALKGRNGVGQLFLYQATKEAAEAFRQKAHGAVFDTIIVDTFRLHETLLPAPEVHAAFESIAKPIFDLLLKLQLKNTNLRTTRDLLLPKLISGELDVSHLPEPEAMTA
jgi:type I restriction enzyme S subunit